MPGSGGPYLGGARGAAWRLIVQGHGPRMLERSVWRERHGMPAKGLDMHVTVRACAAPVVDGLQARRLRVRRTWRRG